MIILTHPLKNKNKNKKGKSISLTGQTLEILVELSAA